MNAIALSALRDTSRSILNLLLPPRCLRCGGVTEGGGALCAGCWSQIGFLSRPFCAKCGLPFDLDPGDDAVCAGCIARPPEFDRARSVFRYDEHSRALVLRFKHADRIGAAPQFAQWLARAGADLLKDANLIVPVPLHRWRLWKRRYNQAALLSLSLANLANVACVPDALVRVRATPSQGTLSRRERHLNIRSAFRLARPESVKGKRILLIDDVLTSGATTGECAKVLKVGGAVAVDVLTLARVVLTEG